MNTYRVVKVFDVEEINEGHYLVQADVFLVRGHSRAEPETIKAQVEADLSGEDPRYYILKGRKREKIRIDRQRKFLGRLKAEDAPHS